MEELYGLQAAHVTSHLNAENAAAVLPLSADIHYYVDKCMKLMETLKNSRICMMNPHVRY
jgi:hypothetical protein